jgi:peptidylprolyl isomerase
MANVKKGDAVKVNYTGTLADGKVFDTTDGKTPFEFIVGSNDVIPGFSDAFISMQAGESKTVTIPAAEAYGPYYDDLTKMIKRDLFPDSASLNVGQPYPMMHKDGTPVVVKIKELTDENVTIDANHPMAGKDLTFKLELLEIK